MNNAGLDQENFSVSLGYSVSGTVSYSGAQAGVIYLQLSTNNCGGDPLGTRLTAPGAFTIRGVPPGTYTLQAKVGLIGLGYPNASDASGSTSSVTVSNADVTGASLTLADPAAITLATGPGLTSVNPADQGVVVNFTAVTTAKGTELVEMASSYELQWSTSSSFTSPGSFSFKAGGANGTGVWFVNNGTSGISGTFSNGTAYYFRARGISTGGNGPWTVYGGSTPTAVTIGAPTAGNTVSGTVTFSGTPTGPLYVGFFDQNTGIAYATHVTNPVSPQSYSVHVPNGSKYFFFGILDQNNDGMIGPGDVSNTRKDSSSAVTISGDATESLTLPTTSSTATVTTQHWTQTQQSGTSTGYQLHFDVREGNKLPVSATLTAGPGVINPIDIGKCQMCGSNQFQYYTSIGSLVPTVGDTYGFLVTYSDGTSATVPASVTAVLDAFATGLAPNGTSSTSLQPTFTWTYPSNPGNYVYQFSIDDNNGNQIWQIPSNSSKMYGFPSSVTSIVWGTDPTGNSSNTPSVTNLTNGVQYQWVIQAQDAIGNTAMSQIYYIP